MNEIEAPRLDWYERYKRMREAVMVSAETTEKVLIEKFGVEEGVRLYCERIQPMVSITLGKKLIEKIDFKPDVEGVIKLLLTYVRELWAFGDDRFVDAKLITPNKGIFAILQCGWWENQFSSEEYRERGITCEPGCISEFTALTRLLSPDIKLKFMKSYPRGNRLCEMSIEK